MTVARDYVVQTHPCSEALAKANLEAHGFEVYLPTVIDEIRHGRMREKRLEVEAPLFPGYLFVRFDIGTDPWRVVSAAKGVKRLMGADSEHPTPLGINTLDELRARFLAGEFVRRSNTYIVSAGDRVTVRQGAFQGHAGVCKVSRGERVKVLLSILSGSVLVDLAAENVAVAV